MNGSVSTREGTSNRLSWKGRRMSPWNESITSTTTTSFNCRSHNDPENEGVARISGNQGVEGDEIPPSIKINKENKNIIQGAGDYIVKIERK